MIFLMERATKFIAVYPTIWVILSMAKKVGLATISGIKLNITKGSSSKILSMDMESMSQNSMNMKERFKMVRKVELAH